MHGTVSAAGEWRGCGAVEWLSSPLTPAADVQGRDKDLLFIATERYDFCILEYKADGTLQTLSHGELQVRVVVGDCFHGGVADVFVRVVVVVGPPPSFPHTTTTTTAAATTAAAVVGAGPGRQPNGAWPQGHC